MWHVNNTEAETATAGKNGRVGMCRYIRSRHFSIVIANGDPIDKSVKQDQIWERDLYRMLKWLYIFTSAPDIHV